MRGVNLSPAHPHAGGVLQRSGEPLVTDRRCALDETKYVKARAARLLGVSERSLWYKLRKHGLS